MQEIDKTCHVHLNLLAKHSSRGNFPKKLGALTVDTA